MANNLEGDDVLTHHRQVIHGEKFEAETLEYGHAELPIMQSTTIDCFTENRNSTEYFPGSDRGTDFNHGPPLANSSQDEGDLGIEMSTYQSRNGMKAFHVDLGDGYTNAAFNTDDEIKASGVSLNDIDHVNMKSTAETDGIPLKYHTIQKEVNTITNCYIRQIFFSIVRNVLCWTFLVCMLIIIANASTIRHWTYDSVAILGVTSGFGIMGLFAHVWRGFNDLSFNKPTVVASLLKSALLREDFTKLMQNRQLSAPELFMRVELKSGAMSDQDPAHWTRSGDRSTVKEISYQGWADQSLSIHQLDWPDTAVTSILNEDGTVRNTRDIIEKKASWLIVSKDFRCLDENTSNALQSEVATFKDTTGYNDNSYFMSYEYILQWKDCEPCPDAQVMLLLNSMQNRGLYLYDFYRFSWFVALDSVYRILFHFSTKHLDNYFIVKFIEK